MSVEYNYQSTEEVIPMNCVDNSKMYKHYLTHEDSKEALKWCQINSQVNNNLSSLQWIPSDSQPVQLNRQTVNRPSQMRVHQMPIHMRK